MPIPYVYDSSGAEGERGPADTNGRYTLRRDGETWLVTVSVHESWLADPARVFPVMVDPTMTAGSNDNRSSGPRRAPGVSARR